jgi:beta-glucosidase
LLQAWHRLEPEVLYWAPRLPHSIWKPKEIYITENGCAASDEMAADGNVYDSDRLMYLRTEWRICNDATVEGVPVKGNFVWGEAQPSDGIGIRGLRETLQVEPVAVEDEARRLGG